MTVNLTSQIYRTRAVIGRISRPFCCKVAVQASFWAAMFDLGLERTVGEGAGKGEKILSTPLYVLSTVSHPHL